MERQEDPEPESSRAAWKSKGSFVIAGRLKARGLRVLVERSVRTDDFPEYDVFDPQRNGAMPLPRNAFFLVHNILPSPMASIKHCCCHLKCFCQKRHAPKWQ